MGSSRITGARVLAATVLVLAPLGVTAPAASTSGPPGTLLSTGGNGFGQLGDAGVTQRLTPGPVDGLAGVVQMHSGREHGVARTDDGRVFTWGSNQRGQLGLGGGNRSTATQVPGLSGVRAVSTGHYHTLAVDADGDVWTWGLNASGQLGDGTTSNRSSPRELSGLPEVVEVAAGRNMSYARTSSGLVYAWGRNGSGQLGDGTTVSRLTPVRVGSLVGVTQIAGGRDHGLAVDGDGAVWAWGWNRYGQLGDGTQVDRVAPRRVVPGGVVQVIAGAHHSLALRSNGTVASWGRGYRGALGSGGTSLRTSPGDVGGVSGAVAIGAGRDHGLAVLGDGRVRVWGDNPSGQLGDGTTTRRLTPVWMVGVDDAVSASGGQAHSLVHVSDGSAPPAPPPPANEPPRALIGVTCVDLACEFDGSGSSDDQGVTSYGWTFGDGATSSQLSPAHRYASAGTYTVTLTVSDAEGLEDTATTQVEVTQAPTPPPTDPSGVAFRAADEGNMNRLHPFVTIPAAVQQGDTLLLFVSTNKDVSAAPPPGWTEVGNRNDSELRSRVFTRAAASGSAGSEVRVALGEQSKASLVVAAYDGATDVASAGSAIRIGRGRDTATPTALLGSEEAWVLSYWVDKSGSNTGWSLPPGTRHRESSIGSGGGRIVAALADDGPTSGDWSGLTATSAASGTKSIGWTIVLR